MKIETAVCPSCGAALKIRKGQETARCEYCGSDVLISGNESTAAREPVPSRETGTFQKDVPPREAAPSREAAPPRETAGMYNDYQQAAASERLAPRKHSVLPPPGFRTRSIPKMIGATIGYLFLFYVVIDMDDWWDTVFLLLASLSVIDICTDWTGIYSGLPGLRSPSSAIRGLMKIVWSTVFFIAWVFIMVLLQKLFNVN